MAEKNPERNLHVVLAVSAAALVVGAMAGGVGFVLIGAQEHLWVGVRAGALLSQTLVWGGVIFVGLGHWAYEGYKAVTGQGEPSAAELELAVDPNQIERPLDQAAANTASTPAAPAKEQSKRYEEVSV